MVHTSRSLSRVAAAGALALAAACGESHTTSARPNADGVPLFAAGDRAAPRRIAPRTPSFNVVPSGSVTYTFGDIDYSCIWDSPAVVSNGLSLPAGLAVCGTNGIAGPLIPATSNGSYSSGYQATQTIVLPAPASKVSINYNVYGNGPNYFVGYGPTGAEVSRGTTGGRNSSGTLTITGDIRKVAFVGYQASVYYGPMTVVYGPSNQAPTITLPSSVSTAQGTAVAITATAADADNDALTYKWDIDNDGAIDSTKSVPGISLTLVDAGTRVVKVTVDDGKGGTAAASTVVSVTNVAPTVNAGSNATLSGGATLDLSATFSDPGTNDGAWSFIVDWGDNTATTTGTTATQTAIVAHHQYAAPAAYTVTVTVTDRLGASASSQLTATVANRAPTANAGFNNLAHDGYVGAEGAAIAFTGTGADADGDPLTYAWTFSDGATATGASASHAFGDNGSYTATLTVSDNHGGSATSIVGVQVSNVNPTATLALPGAAVAEGSSFTIALTGAADVVADLSSLKYQFDCGAGFGPLGASAAASCSTDDNRAYGVRARVVDKDGGASEYAGSVNVVNVAPSVALAAGNTSLVSGQSYALNGTFADPGLDSWTYSIAWGTGAPTSGTTASKSIAASRQYLAAGTYTVTLSVSDDDNGQGSASVTVTVSRLSVGLDVKPGSSDNPVKLNDKGNGDIPVAVLSGATFDASLVNVASVRLGTTAVAKRNNGTYMSSLEDVNGDGRADLVLHFERDTMIGAGDLAATTTQLQLVANLTDGRQIGASDVVRVIP